MNRDPSRLSVRCRQPLRIATVIALLFVAVHATAAPIAIADLDKPADGSDVRARLARADARLRGTPTDAIAYLERGEALFQLHAFDDAVAAFDRAVALDPKLDDAYFARGMARARAGDIDGGIADLGVYVRRHPDSTLAHTKRGVRFLWKGDLDHARADFERAIALDPRNAEAHDDLGTVFARRQDFARAAQHFAAAIRLEPNYQKAYHNLALVYYLVGDERRALVIVDEALRLRSDDRDSTMLKSLILKALGHVAEAKKLKEDAEFMPQGNWSERSPLP